MSEVTKQVIDEAIRAHVTDESGEPRIVTEWYVISAAVSTEAGETHYQHVVSDSPWHSLTGLVHLAWRRMSSWTDIEDEDDE